MFCKVNEVYSQTIPARGHDMAEVHFPQTSTVGGVFLLGADDLKELDAISTTPRKR